MKNILNVKKTEERDCLFIKKSNCSILKTIDCEKCKFYVKNSPEYYL